jgi:hypothetical protein
MAVNQPFSRNCPIRQRTADGESVGRCWHYCGLVELVNWLLHRASAMVK